MGLRKATLLAATGIAAGVVTEVAGNLEFFLNPPEGFSNTRWISGLFYTAQVLMMSLLVMLYREMGGKGKPSRRQDLAILATIVSGLLLHAHATREWRLVPMVEWVVLDPSIAVAWIAFLILLVKDAVPLQARAMRAVAPVLAVLPSVRLCRVGYLLFLRVGLEWMNLSTQRSLGALFWNLLFVPAVEIFRGLSMVIFLILLWRYSWNHM